MSNYERESEGKSASISLALAPLGIFFSLIWLGWTFFYFRYLESYSSTMYLLLLSAPQIYPYVERSLFLSIYLVAQILVYNGTKELLGLIWYSSIVVAMIFLGLFDVLLIALSKESRRQKLCMTFGIINLFMLFPLLLGPQIALYFLAARLPVYLALVTLT